ncbi:MAG: hypothetical protein AB1489_35305, partial [Acidobacteriota bacterium]
PIDLFNTAYNTTDQTDIDNLKAASRESLEAESVTSLVKDSSVTAQRKETNSKGDFTPLTAKQGLDTGSLLRFNMGRKLAMGEETAGPTELLAALIYTSTLTMDGDAKPVDPEQAAKAVAGQLAKLFRQYRYDLDDSLASTNKNPLQKTLQETKKELEAAKARKAELEKPAVPGSEVAETLKQIPEIDKQIAAIQAEGRKTSRESKRKELQLQLLVEIAKRRSVLEKALLQQSDPKVIEYIVTKNKIEQLEKRIPFIETHISTRKDLIKIIGGFKEKDSNRLSFDKIKENFELSKFTPETLEKLQALKTNPREVIEFFQFNDLLKKPSPFYNDTHDIGSLIQSKFNDYAATVTDLKTQLRQNEIAVARLKSRLSQTVNLPLDEYVKDWGIQVPKPILDQLKQYLDMFNDAISVWKVAKLPWIIDDLDKLDGQFKDAGLPGLQEIFQQEFKKYWLSSEQGKDAIEGALMALGFTAGELVLGSTVMAPIAIGMLFMMIGGNINRLEEILDMPRAENTIITDGPFKDSEEVVKAKNRAHAEKQEQAIRKYFRSVLSLGTQVATGVGTAKGVNRGINSAFKDPLIKASEVNAKSLAKEAKLAETKARQAEVARTPDAAKLREAANTAKTKAEASQQQLENLKKSLSQADKAFQDMMEAYRSGKTRDGRTLEQAKADFMKSRETVKKVLDNANSVPSEATLLKQLAEVAETEGLGFKTKPALIEELLETDVSGKFLPMELKEPVKKLRELLTRVNENPKIVEEASFQRDFKANAKQVLSYIAKQMELPRELNMEGLPEYFLEGLKLKISDDPSLEAAFNPEGVLQFNPAKMAGRGQTELLRLLVHEFSHANRATLLAALKKTNPELYQRLVLNEVLDTIGKPRIREANGDQKPIITDPVLLKELRRITQQHIEKPLTDAQLRVELDTALKSLDAPQLEQVFNSLKEFNLKLKNPIETEVQNVLSSVKDYLEKFPEQRKALETDLTRELSKTQNFRLIELLLGEVKTARKTYDEVLQRIGVREQAIAESKPLQRFMKDLETRIKRLTPEQQNQLYGKQLREVPSILEGLDATQTPRELLKYYRSAEELQARNSEILFVLKLLGDQIPLAKLLKEQWQRRPMKPLEAEKLPEYQKALENWQRGLDKVLTEIGKDNRLKGLEKYSRELEVLSRLRELDTEWGNFEAALKTGDAAKITAASEKLYNSVQEIRQKLDYQSPFYSHIKAILDAAQTATQTRK